MRPAGSTLGVRPAGSTLGVRASSLAHRSRAAARCGAASGVPAAGDRRRHGHRRSGGEGSAHGRVRRHHAVVAVAVDARRWHQGGALVAQCERGQRPGAPVRRGAAWGCRTPEVRRRVGVTGRGRTAGGRTPRVLPSGRTSAAAVPARPGRRLRCAPRRRARSRRRVPSRPSGPEHPARAGRGGRRRAAPAGAPGLAAGEQRPHPATGDRSAAPRSPPCAGCCTTGRRPGLGTKKQPGKRARILCQSRGVPVHTIRIDVPTRGGDESSPTLSESYPQPPGPV